MEALTLRPYLQTKICQSAPGKQDSKATANCSAEQNRCFLATCKACCSAVSGGARMGCPVPPQPCKNCLSSCAAALSTALCSSFWVLWYMLWTLTVKGALQISRPLGKSESVGLASPPPTSQKGARSGSPPGEHSIDTKSISQDVNNLFCTCPFTSCNEPCSSSCLPLSRSSGSTKSLGGPLPLSLLLLLFLPVILLGTMQKTRLATSPNKQGWGKQLSWRRKKGGWACTGEWVTSQKSQPIYGIFFPELQVPEVSSEAFFSLGCLQKMGIPQAKKMADLRSYRIAERKPKSGYWKQLLPFFGGEA